MKRFLVGLAMGLPIGMLLADTVLGADRKWQERAREWMNSASGGLEDVGQRIREAVAEDLRKLPGNAGENVADLVNRQAEQSRASAAVRNEHAVLNTVARDELLGVYGIGPVLADRILAGRPYGNDREVVERGILNERVFEQLQRQVLDKHRKSA